MAALSFVGVLLAVVADADVARVTLMKDGASVALTEPERTQIAERVRVLMVGCGITSVTEPGLFSARSLPKEWKEIQAGSHLEVRYAKPLEATRGRVRISEVLMGLEDPNLVGPELSRHDGRVVGHVKCDGHRALAVMCATALRDHLLPGQSEACKIYDKIGEPRDPK
jgi:hypothetical protein